MERRKAEEEICSVFCLSEVWKNEWIWTFYHTELVSYDSTLTKSETRREKSSVWNCVPGLVSSSQDINCLLCTWDVSRLTVTQGQTRVYLHSVIFTLRSGAASSSSSLVVVCPHWCHFTPWGNWGGDFLKSQNIKLSSLEWALRAVCCIVCTVVLLLLWFCICWTVDYWLDQQLKYWLQIT